VDPVTREIKKAEKVMEEMERWSAKAEWPQVLTLLTTKADELVVSTRLLRECGIGKAVRKLGKKVQAAGAGGAGGGGGSVLGVKAAVVKQADALVAKWKKIVADNGA
jgi:hypothetical protein